MSKISTALGLLKSPSDFKRVLKEKTTPILHEIGFFKSETEKIFYKSLKQRIAFRYENVIGCKPNLSRPARYTEKAQWRKIYCKDIRKISRVTDKALVYDYVEGKIKKEHLLPILFLAENITAMDIKSLGDNIVLQPTHCSGQVIFIKENDRVNHELIASRLNENLKYPYSIESNEPWYGYAYPRIMARPLVTNSDGSEFLNDCKIHVFNRGDGSQKLICEIINTYPHWRAIFDENFVRLNFDWSPDVYPAPEFEVEKPVSFGEMVQDAKKLASEFDYVRVDFMLGAKEYYFTEMTFAPAGGLPNMEPQEMDLVVGGYWNLDTGNFLKRRYWFLKAWLPLWKYERPSRNITRLYKKIDQILTVGMSPAEYTLEDSSKEQ